MSVPLYPRVVPHTSLTELVSMAMMLYSIPRIASTNVEAVIVYPGMGEHWRVCDAIRVLQSSEARLLVIAGQNKSEKTHIELTLDVLTRPPFNLPQTKSVRDLGSAIRTLDQSETVAEFIAAERLTRVALCASPYHLFRASLILIKSLLKRKIACSLIPVPSIVSPATNIPEQGVDAWQLTPGEIAGIIAQQSKGNACTFAELKQYLNWLYQQPILTSLIAHT